MDHGVAVIGFEADQAHEIETEYTTTETFCREQAWYDWSRFGGCIFHGETLSNGMCCWDETHTEVIVRNKGSPYFTIMNSWGHWWGENGTVRLALEFDGDGPCGMNVEPLWVTGYSL